MVPLWRENFFLPPFRFALSCCLPPIPLEGSFLLAFDSLSKVAKRKFIGFSVSRALRATILRKKALSSSRRRQPIDGF